MSVTIPAVGVLVLILIIFYIEGGIDKSVNCYVCCWDVGRSVVSIDVEVPIDWTGYSRNDGFTIIGAIDWLFSELETIKMFYFD